MAAYVLPAAVVGDDIEIRDDQRFEILRAQGRIEIDGSLGDPGWRGATLASEFVEQNPGDQTRPVVKTKAYITYDDENFYVSCICYDNPDEIRATYCDRDQLVGNDVIILMLDTYGEAARAYNLYVNPFGVQTDAMWSPGRNDFDYDVIYESAGRITDSGYQVEIKVPFSSLHFPGGEEQVWKFNILRIRPRESWFEYSWSPLDRNNPCVPCQWNTIFGMKDVRPAKGLEILPSAIGYQFGEAAGSRTATDPYFFDNYDPEGEMALNVKYKPLSNMSFEATVNPDFSQIEPDAGQIDLNTTSALFFPERRPFFQEASELFFTWRMAYYSRMINDPRAAVKGTGKVGKTDFGYIFAYDEHSPFILSFRDASINLIGGESFSNVLRLRRTFGQDTYGAIMVTDRQIKGGGSGMVVNFDGQLRLHENWRFQTQMMASRMVEPVNDELNNQIRLYIERGWIDSTFDFGRHTAILDGETYSGQYLMFNIEERSRHFDFDLGYLEASPSYRSDLGFLRTNNWRSFETFGNYTIYYDNSWLEVLEPNFSLISRWDFEGRSIKRDITLGLSADIAGQLGFSASAHAGDEYFRGVRFEDIRSASLNMSKSFSEQIYISTSLDYGREISRSDLVVGNQTLINCYAYLRPHDRLLIEPEYSYTRSIDAENKTRLFEGYIARTRMNYFFNREFNIRLIVQYNDIYETLNIDPLITYRINPFTVFYLGTSYEYCQLPCTENGFEEENTYLNRRQFFVKLQYMIQI
jgi:hypothetical protein